MMRLILSFVLLTVLNPTVHGQDTLFVTKHNFESPVRNVFNVGRDIYVKTSEDLFLLNNEEWILQKSQFNKAYVFFDKDFYESDYIPNSEIFDASGIKELIPQKGLFITTAAISDHRLFLASGSSLFEYQVFDHYSKSYPNTSIRDIFIDDSLKVISTYSGIFVNDTLKLKTPNYLNGPLKVFGNSYFLCNDVLYQFYPPDSTRIIEKATNIFAGDVRNMVEWNDNLYSQNTQSINLLSEDFDLTPIHRGEEYLDLVAIEDGLIFSTYSGKCFFWDGEETKQLAELDSKIRHIFPFEDLIYLASDNGVYTIKDLDPSSQQKVFDTRYNVHVEKDKLGNIWIATENGLFVSTKDYPDLLNVIEKVEFNREAFFIKENDIYAGAVDGLYTLNLMEISKSFIPSAINNIKVQSPFNKVILYSSIGVSVVIVAILLWMFKFRHTRKKDDELIEKAKSTLDLKELEALITQNRLNSVEALANFLETNTVQLNRNFREFEVTPGKFLKMVKLNHAKQLLEEGNSLEDVANLIGYSSRFLKKELDELD